MIRLSSYEIHTNKWLVTTWHEKVAIWTIAMNQHIVSMLGLLSCSSIHSSIFEGQSLSWSTGDTTLNKIHIVLPAHLKGQWRLQKNKHLSYNRISVVIEEIEGTVFGSYVIQIWEWEMVWKRWFQTWGKRCTRPGAKRA